MAEPEFTLDLASDYIMPIITWLQIVSSAFFSLFKSPNSQTGLPVVSGLHLVFSYPKTWLNALLHITILFPLLHPYTQPIHPSSSMYSVETEYIIKRPKSSDILKRKQENIKFFWRKNGDHTKDGAAKTCGTLLHLLDGAIHTHIWP